MVLYRDGPDNIGEIPITSVYDLKDILEQN
jgi:hypothetical protein